jgi:hypothetical protein
MTKRCSSIPGWAVAVGLLVSAGCDCQEAVDSQRAQLGFDNPFRGSTPSRFVSGDPVVEGSTFCPHVVQWYEGSTCVPIGAEPDEYFEPCWDVRANGPVRALEDGCFGLDTPGAVRLELDPQPCAIEIDPPEFGPDRLEFDVRALEDLAAAPVWELERRAELEGSAGPGGAFPTDWLESPDAEVRIVEGGPYIPLLGLYDPQALEFVASQDGGVRFAVLEGEPVVLTDLPGVELAAGDEVRADFDVAAGTASGPTLVGVARSEVASMQLVPIYAASDTNPWGPPTAVRAVVRDAQGQLLRASDVQWSFDSAAVDPVLDLGDRVWLGTECTDGEPQPRKVDVVATIDAISASAELEWVDETCLEAPDDPFAADDSDLDFDFLGCACRSQPGSTPPSIAFMLCVLGLGLGAMAARGGCGAGPCRRRSRR